ncbi:helix-turn-helix transcriptional regulator [Adhaeribacter terreus]|uniref:Helix-turn-helix transcriptional regulator n=1 Tax=Adhaeribacter terreus TaxID=529703 RepID=A0ABW0EAM0_9BACT
MIDRLRKIATHFNLSPAAFADLVGVSRPVISHIFSERNKPSLEVVQKVGSAFPELNLEWLLFGNGEMLKTVAAKHSEISLQPNTEFVPLEEKIDLPKPLDIQKNPIHFPPETDKTFQKTEPAKVIKIVLFYADNTFSEFKPS